MLSIYSLFSLALLLVFFFISRRLAPKEDKSTHGTSHAGQIGLLAVVALFGVDYYTSFFYGTGEMLHALHPYGLQHYAFYAVAFIAMANMVFGFLYMYSLGPFNEGGGSYTASMRYLVPTLSLIVAVTLIADYVLTIVVSALSGADQFLSILNLYDTNWIFHFLIGASLACVTWYLTIRGRGESSRSVFMLLCLFVFLTITMAIGLMFAYMGGVSAVGMETYHETVPLSQALMHLLTASMKGMVALSGLEALSNGIQFIKDEDAGPVRWGKKHLPKLKKLWNFYSGKSGIGRIVQTSFLFYGGLSMLFLSFFALHFNVFDGTLGKTLVGNLAFIGFTQIPGGELLFWVYQCLAVLLLAAASMTAFQDAQATEWRDVAIGAIPEVIVKRDRRGTFTRSVTLTFFVAIAIMFLVKGKTTLAVPLYSIGVFLPISVMGFAIRKHVLTHFTGKRRILAAIGATFAGLLGITVFLGQIVGKWQEGGWIILIVFVILFLFAHLLIISPGGLRSATQIHRIVRDKARVQGSMASIVEWQSMKMQEYRYSVLRTLSRLLEGLNIRVPMSIKNEIEPVAVGDYDHSLHFDHPEAPSFLDEHINVEVGKSTQQTHQTVLEQYTLREYRNSVIIPIRDLDAGTLKALRYAQSMSTDVTAVHIARDTVSTKTIQKKWDLLAHGVRLKVLEPNIEHFLAPLIAYIEYIDSVRQSNQVITVLVPQVIETSFFGKLRARTAMTLRLAFSANDYITVVDIPYTKHDKRSIS